MKVFIWRYSLKVETKTLKRLLLLNKLRVESCSWAKESWEVERKQGSPEKWMKWLKKLSLKSNFSNIWYKLKFSHTFPGLSPLIWVLENFIIGWRYTPDSLCLSISHFFTSQLLAELKNTNMILKQLQKSNASKGQKRWSTNWPCWLVLITKRSLQHTFSCYISSGGGSFIS